MGIARRKAGTVVHCPKCQGQVEVPQLAGEEAQEEGSASAGDQPANLFEAADFSKFLKIPNGPATAPAPGGAFSAAAPAKPAPQAPAATWPGHPLPEQATGPRGLFMTPGILTLACVLVILLMGLAFFVGLLLGKSTGTS